MSKVFNVNGACHPDLHYMVDLTPRLTKIKAMTDTGKFFSINKARQYGKTTTLRALAEFLQDSYTVLGLDFQNIESDEFEDGSSFVHALAREINKKIRRLTDIPEEILQRFTKLADKTIPKTRMAELFACFSDWCRQSDKPLILIIDEVDSAANNQVFLDFLAQLRAAYLDRYETPTFQSVILAGVYDIRSIKSKLRTDSEHLENSPWNIAADFLVDMSFSVNDIAGMLNSYEDDLHTGMDIKHISQLIYDSTSGYPYLVSRLCSLMDEWLPGIEPFSDQKSTWTEAGFYEAEKIIIKEDNALYQSLIQKLKYYPELRTMLYDLLFTGKPIPYVATNSYIKDAAMFGFIKNVNDSAVITNRIFETVLYNYFVSEEFASRKMYRAGVQEKNQFITGGHLDIQRILVKFVETFDFLYGDQDETFLEEAGRRYFILFLKPIINGIGNYSVESRTRNNERMDLVIYYQGEQYVVELKLWRGNAYHERGEEQLSSYLEYFHLTKGYMLSFNFNKKKEIGVKEIKIGNKTLIEAVV